MEQIAKRNGIYYYGETECFDASDAYRRFRSDYNRSVGRNVRGRLDYSGKRTERSHEFGFCFRDGIPSPPGGYDVQSGRVRSLVLGIVQGAYCRLVDTEYAPEDSETFEQWLDWILTKGNKALMLAGRGQRSGRTNRYYLDKHNKKH